MPENRRERGTEEENRDRTERGDGRVGAEGAELRKTRAERQGVEEWRELRSGERRGEDAAAVSSHLGSAACQSAPTL